MVPGECSVPKISIFSKSTLSGNSFYRGDTEPGASTSLAKKAQFKGRTVHRGNTTGPQFSLPRPRYERLSYRPATALFTAAEWAVPQGTLGPRCSLGGEYHHGIPSA